MDLPRVDGVGFIYSIHPYTSEYAYVIAVSSDSDVGSCVAHDLKQLAIAWNMVEWNI